MPGPVTLVDLIAMGIGVRACCDRCGQVFSAAELAARLGPATPLPALRHVLKCSACDSRDCAPQPNYQHRGPMER